MPQPYTFLGLTNEVLQHFNETLLTSANFAAATGFHADVQESVNSTIHDIYEEEDYRWPFNYVLQTEILLTDGTQDYALASGATSVDWNTMYLAQDVALDDGEHKDLIFNDWHSYTENGLKKSDGDTTDSANYNKPDKVVKTPDNKIRITPKADAAYTLTYDSWTYPTELSAHSDVPAIPEGFSNLIISGTKVYAYKFRDNEEQSQAQDQKFRKKLDRMRRLLIPQSDYIVAET